MKVTAIQQIIAKNISIITNSNSQTSSTFSSKHLVVLWYSFSLLLVCIDQAAKYAIETLLPLHASIEVNSFFNLVHVLNPGAAFSFLADAGGWQRYLFIGLAGIVSTFLMFVLWKGVRSRFEIAAYICIIAGALGNLIDRLRIGAVVDFLDFHWRGLHWPSFNLADLFIVIGTILMILSCVVESTINQALQRRIGGHDKGAKL